jgi:dihydrofolate reductase
MSQDNFHITIHMVASVDGFIAKKDNSIGWFETSSPYEKGEVGQDVVAFLQTIDCYIMGANTYQLAVELSKNYGWAYGDTPTIVLTNRQLVDDRPNIQFYNGNLNQLISEKLKPNFKNVWVVGGASLCKQMMQQQLADTIRISILPIILGDGLPYFDQIGLEQKLRLINTIAYKNGMVELSYELIK